MPDQQPQQGSKIPNFEWGLVIGATAVVDVVQIVLDMFVIGAIANRFIDIVVGMALAGYFWIRGVKLNAKKILSLIASFVGEEIPVIDALPLWTLDVILIMAWDKAEGKIEKAVPILMKSLNTAERITNRIEGLKNQPNNNSLNQKTPETTQRQNSMNNVLDLQNKIPQTQPLKTKTETGGSDISEGLALYHGGLPEDASIEDVDLERLGTQQNKKGNTYGGFYLTDDSSRHWSESYARERGASLHSFDIHPQARILDAGERNTDRLSAEERQTLAQNHDLIKGKDALGRTQYTLLNKSVVTNMKSVPPSIFSETRRKIQPILTSSTTPHHQELVQDVRQSKLDWIQSEAFAQRLQTWGATMEDIENIREQLTQNALDGNAYILSPDKFKQTVNILQKTTGEENIKEASAFHDSVNHSIFLQERTAPPRPPLSGQNTHQFTPTPKVDPTELHHEYGHLVAGDIWDKPLFRNWKPRFKAGAPDSAYVGLIQETDTRIRSMFRDIRELFDPVSEKFDLKHLVMVKKLRGQGQVSKDTKDLLEHYDDNFLIELANTMPAI